MGSLWYHHVYMPAQNPGDPSGMSAYGRWMYGPWFWPPAPPPPYGPIANPYYDPAASSTTRHLAVPADPFCEPPADPGHAEHLGRHGAVQRHADRQRRGLSDLTLDPKSYRFRILNAANDRFFNFQWYVADPTDRAPTAKSR